MDAHQETLTVLRKAYQLEVDGYTFYSMTADRSRSLAVQELFARLAGDERQHQAFLREVAGSFGEKGAKAFDVQLSSPDLAEFSDAIFTTRLRREAEGAEFEAGVLSVAMALETSAVSYFTRSAGQADTDEVRSFYQFLAAWERQHLEALQNAYNAIREDFWKSAGF